MEWTFEKHGLGQDWWEEESRGSYCFHCGADSRDCMCSGTILYDDPIKKNPETQIEDLADEI